MSEEQPFDSSPLAVDVTQQATDELARKAARGLDAILTEGIVRKLGEMPPLTDLKGRLSSQRVITDTWTHYFLDGELIVSIEVPQLVQSFDVTSQCVMRVNQNYRFPVASDG